MSGVSVDAAPAPVRAPVGGALAGLERRLSEIPALTEVLGRRSATLAVADRGRTAAIAGLAATSTRRPIVVVVGTGAEAEVLGADLRTWLGDECVETFPAWETLPFERVSPQIETMGRRSRVAWRLRSPERRPDVVVTSARALVQRLGPHVGETEPVVVRPGAQLDPQQLVEDLVRQGYRREQQVEHRGEVAVRGSIVDVFPSTADGPVRIDLWGDEVDRLCEFAVADQRSTTDLDVVEIFPCRELLPTDDVRARADVLVGEEPWGRDQWERLREGQTFDGMESWLPWLCVEDVVLTDLLGDDAQLVVCEPRRVRDRAADIAAEERDLASTLAVSWGAGDADLPRLHLDLDLVFERCDAPMLTVLPTAGGPDTPTVETQAWLPVAPDGIRLMQQVRDLISSGSRVVVAAERDESAERLDRILRSHGFVFDRPPRGEARFVGAGGTIVSGASLEAGAVLPEAGIAILAESDLTGRRRARRSNRRQARAVQGFFDDLEVGSYVVHQTHGVGRFGGMVTRAIGGVERDYLLLEYRGDDKLYVPSDQIESIRLYTGAETPRLNKMGGSEFARTKAAVRAEVTRIAQELVVLYQKRRQAKGFSFSPDTAWQKELEDAFPYEETPDQLTAIADVKADMESDTPMDRLVCGDVGFGKTEVAIRAAFKAVQDGKQVAILVPTTLLAQQHFTTFSERFDPFGVKVEVLSRFLTAGQAKRVVEGVQKGEIDVIIGTHRLLSSDMAYKDLGLLIIDEEQRFGVSHKETIKQLSTSVDVLTMTATPIPRTLEMSLTGIRDLSLLNTPPVDRQPILTYVGEYDERAVAEAIRRELLREGQVFFVHNRVADIEQTAERLREMVPEARITIAHGQMDEALLEQVVFDFWEGRSDVLVCTTIIESGIDMPTVNTLVVDRADLLGLGQLHQLRGRVGRAGSRAYAYLFHPKDRTLSEEAYERLRTIGEATELGSGFRIAMRDLEIRGAGNLLGTGQSGHVASVGYDMYVQMVSEALGELSGTAEPEPGEIRIELPLDAHLPTTYVEREDQRLEAYRRLAEVEKASDVADIESEWVDRFGPVPPPARRLLEIATVRVECLRAGVTDLVVTKSGGIGGPPWMARISPLKLLTSKQMRLERTRKGAVCKPDAREVQLPLQGGDAMVADLLGFFEEFVPEDAPSAPAEPA